MPNHFTTKVVFDRSMSDELKKFLRGLEDIQGGLCEALMPMPDIVRNTGSGFRTFKGPDGKEIEARSWYEPQGSTSGLAGGMDSARMFTPEESAELLKIGASNWYDWAAKFWGTKWGTYDSTVDGPRTWRCTSAWGAPYDEIFQRLCDKFGVDFTTYGMDEGENEFTRMGRFTVSPPELKPKKRAKPKAKKRAACPKPTSKKKK